MVATGVRVSAALLAAWLTSGALAAPAAAPVDYRPPVGLNGHLWDQPLRDVRGLTLWRANTALNSNGKMTDVSIGCKPDLPCTTDQQVQGDGSFALAEYYFAKDQNPWAAQRVQLYIITYLFCAQWQGDYLPRDMKKNLKMCGVRLMFHSDTKQELATRGLHYESNYDRLIRQLIAEHGEPPGYQRTPTVTIETADQTLTAAGEKAETDYRRYRWCGVELDSRRLEPTCSATVTLTFEATTGEGTILYATAPLYRYAFARHDTGDTNNEIYAMLYDRPLDAPKRYEKRRCTGTLICQPIASKMSSRELHAFQP